MTDEQRFRALASAASVGPWSVQGNNCDEWYVYALHARYETLPGNPSPVKVAWVPWSPGTLRHEHDAAYIAAASPDVLLRLLDERDALRHENHNLNWALGTDGYEQMYTEVERAEHAEGMALAMDHIERLAARKARWDALVPAGVDILDHLDALRRQRDEARNTIVDQRIELAALVQRTRDERDAAMALLTEAGMYVNPHTADDPRAMALWKRIDAILGGDKGA